MNYCRLCTALSSNAVSIFGDEGVNMKLAYKINKSLPIVVSVADKLPLHICKECIDHLDATAKFINKCIHTQYKFERLLKAKEDTHSDEVTVIWSNVTFEAEDMPSITFPRPSAGSDPVSDHDHSESETPHMEDSHSYSPVNSPASIEEIECLNKSESKSISTSKFDDLVSGRMQRTDLVKKVSGDSLGAVSGSRENMKDSISTVFQEKNHHDFREKPLEKIRTSIQSGNDVLGNKENTVVTEPARRYFPNSMLSRKQNMHNCKFCNRKFLWKAELFYHQTTSHPDVVFRCRYCLKVFYESNEEYIKHVAAHKVTDTPQMSNKPLPVAERILLKQNTSLGIRYKTIDDDSIYPKKPMTEDSEEDEHWEKLREKLLMNKNLTDKVIKHLIDKKVGGKISLGLLGTPSGQNIKFKCEWCNDEFYTEKEHLKHLRMQHRLRLPCRFCPRTMIDKKQLDLHEAKHKEERKYRCRKCKMEFDTIEKWKEHKKIHLRDKPLVCKFCGKKFDQQWNLKQHSIVHREEKTCLCHRCGKSFRFKTSLRMHALTCGQDPEKAKKNVCRYCGKKYLVPSRLRVHERTHTGEKPFMCATCGKTFHSNERLRAHSNTHVVENVPCNICGFVLKHSKHLKSHLKSHERVQCKKCGLWFEGSRKLGCHQRVHRKTQVVKEEEDPVVPSRSNAEEKSSHSQQMMLRIPVMFQLDNLVIQEDEVQQDVKSPTKIFKSQELERPYECQHCPRKFILHQSLVKHEKEHLNPKRFSCSECGKEFQTLAGLGKHHSSHFMGNKFQCEICDKSFDRKITLLIHKRTHLTGQPPPRNFLQQRVTLVQERLQMGQPQGSLVIPGNVRNDVGNMSAQQDETRVAIGNPDCEGGDFLTFDSNSIDSHCSEVIVVTNGEMT